jgi:hypothetical protein
MMRNKVASLIMRVGLGTVDLAIWNVKPGKLIRDTTIISNDPLYPETIVRVQAEVLE